MALNDCLLNSDDIISLNGGPGPTQNLSHLPDSVLTKIHTAQNFLTASYEIDNTLYDDVYITSDIHSDLRKLNYLLYNTDLISKSTTDDVVNIMTGVAEGGNVDWIKPRTLFIIVGDLVDGARTKNSSHNYDKIGNIELLLLAYLFNLRIKARAVESEIRFTTGNHDYTTVIRSYNHVPYWTNYIHNEAKTFFNSNREHRKACLLPFYNCSPYILLNIGEEVACVHGGLHNDGGPNDNVSINADVVSMQKRIDAYNANLNKFTPLTAAEDNILGDGVGSDPSSGPLFNRKYAKGTSATTCPLIYDTPYTFIVVGHCPTMQTNPSEHHNEIKGADPGHYSDCTGSHGCVVLGCDPTTGGNPGIPGPHLAYVDIGMSVAFRSRARGYPNWREETLLIAEVLHLVHDPALDQSRYYNRIIREKVENGVHTSIDMWVAAPAAVAAAAVAAPAPAPARNNFLQAPANLRMITEMFGGYKNKRTRKHKTRKMRKSRRRRSGLNKSYK